LDLYGRITKTGKIAGGNRKQADVCKNFEREISNIDFLISEKNPDSSWSRAFRGNSTQQIVDHYKNISLDSKLDFSNAKIIDSKFGNHVYL